MSQDGLEQVRAFLDELDEQRAEKLVVRWIDETRPVPEEESGYTVRRVTRVTFTANTGDGVVQETFDDVGYEELRDLVAQYPFETLFRSDNVTR